MKVLSFEKVNTVVINVLAWLRLWQYRLWSFKPGDTNSKDCCLKINKEIIKFWELCLFHLLVQKHFNWVQIFLTMFNIFEHIQKILKAVKQIWILSKYFWTSRWNRHWCSGELSKIGHHLSNKVILKLMSSKNINNKKCAPKLVFFNEKKIEEDFDDFWRRKLTWKVKFWHFLTAPHYTSSQNSIISFGCVD